MTRRGTNVVVRASLAVTTRRWRKVAHIVAWSSQLEDPDRHPVHVLVAAVVHDCPQCVLGVSN